MPSRSTALVPVAGEMPSSGAICLRLIGHARIFRPSKLRVNISANQSG